MQVDRDLITERQVGVQEVLDMQFLSETTGGEVLNSDNLALSSTFSSNDDQALSGLRLWHYLALFALIIYITELLYRRWPFDRTRLLGK